MKYKISTTPNTLKQVWNTLDELELSGLLEGVDVKVDKIVVFRKLLKEDKLNEFCRVVTGADDDFMSVDNEEVLDIIASFFEYTFKDLPELVVKKMAEVMNRIHSMAG